MRTKRLVSTFDPLRGCDSDRAQYSNTPSLRAAGLEDEDEYEAPCGALRFPEMLLQPNSIGFLQPGQDFIIQLVNGFYQEWWT
jgi:hypothetical protein